MTVTLLHLTLLYLTLCNRYRMATLLFVTVCHASLPGGGTMAAICDYLGLDVSDDEISAALGTARDRGSRFNKGVSGRGQSLSEDLKNRIRAYADYYPDVDFSSIGI